MAEYRKKLDQDIWHFSSNCSNYPTTNYYLQFTRPSTGELCKECKSKSDKWLLSGPSD
ncbi:MAG: hypothetical protein ACREQK_11150 [Candidatus Binatia bacterium]